MTDDKIILNKQNDTTMGKQKLKVPPKSKRERI